MYYFRPFYLDGFMAERLEVMLAMVPILLCLAVVLYLLPQSFKPTLIRTEQTGINPHHSHGSLVFLFRGDDENQVHVKGADQPDILLQFVSSCLPGPSRIPQAGSSHFQVDVESL